MYLKNLFRWLKENFIKIIPYQTRAEKDHNSTKRTPGNLVNWMMAETEKLGEMARKGQLYDTRLEEFIFALDSSARNFIKDQPSEPEVVEDAENARLFKKSRLEWIERNKVSRENWVKATADFADKADGFVTRTNESTYKYILVAYGAAFLFCFNSFLSLTEKKDTVLILPLIDALWLLIIGFLCAVFHIWLTIEIRGQSRDYALDMLNAWDPDTTNKPWLLKLKAYWLTRPLILFSILAIPMAALTFVYKLDVWKWISQTAKNISF